MAYEHEKLGRILRASPEVLIDLEQRLDVYTGKQGVMASIVKESDSIVERTLAELGLGDVADQTAERVYGIMMERLKGIDRDLYAFLDKPDLSTMAHACGKLCETILKLHEPQKGFFLKHEKARAMLEVFPPPRMLEHFGYKDVNELCEKQDFSSVFCALRFVETEEWMHGFFDSAYSNLTKDDFEERFVELKVLESEWLVVAEKFLKHKYHNVSHLKELGIIFILPLPIDTEGATLRLVTLMLHYLNEVNFYAKLFRNLASGKQFSDDCKSLLRGDVSTGPLPNDGKLNVRIVQRYLAKDDVDDPRLFEPHVNPEAGHWYEAEHDFSRLASLIKNDSSEIGDWQGLDSVGEFFKNTTGDGKGTETLVSFDLIDLTMSLVKKETVKYLYHHQEALWNKIFIEYLGAEQFHKLIEENMIRGYISL